MNEDAFISCLLGTAVGDSLGLPYEGLSARRARKLFPDTARHHFLFGKGMVSDDTEHACFVAQALIRSKGDVNRFRKNLAWSLRWWLLGLPAGVGLATLRSIIKLWLGWPPTGSGVFSAGNGPAMRSPVLGVAFGHDVELLKQYVKASTEIIHSDPKAYYAALAVALASGKDVLAAPQWQTGFLDSILALVPQSDAREFQELVRDAVISARRNEPVTRFAEKIGSKKGISGYSYHTVPCVLQVWFRHGNDFADRPAGNYQSRRRYRYRGRNLWWHCRRKDWEGRYPEVLDEGHHRMAEKHRLDDASRECGRRHGLRTAIHNGIATLLCTGHHRAQSVLFVGGARARISAPRATVLKHWERRPCLGFRTK